MSVHSRPTLLLTRPRAASERFAEGLDGFDVVIAPLMEIVGTGEPITLDGIAGVILTSENAVPFLPRAALPAYCVGPRTADAARAAGFDADVLGPDADGLVAELSRRAPRGPLLHVHGRHTRGEVEGRLRKAGLEAHGIAVYDQRAVPPDDAFHEAMRQPQVIVPLFSPRSAMLFAEAVSCPLDAATLIAMSDAVRDALPAQLQPRTTVLARPTGAEMRKALEPFGLRRNCT
ncbi:uroporphyrinogen-III synthase [Rhodobacterales bacterium HKCCE4037]|nr:uroporphyrinogen-III synthase [Rhodobacterales bacterium HKCCE4037]